MIGGVEQVPVVGVPRGEEPGREVRLPILVEEPQRRTSPFAKRYELNALTSHPTNHVWKIWMTCVELNQCAGSTR